mmetsp:Transcript_32191/g.78490  ORF Transcript_32191/g.78490 Transcript_32191/m.78490 type:complete len:873 (-) Transcript_32191:1621-4239(-)
MATKKAPAEPPPIGTITVPAAGGGKKKFGKNLNKLTAATAVPATANTKQQQKTENGLLLLSSAKRSSNLATASSLGGNGAGGTGTTGGGGLLSNSSSNNNPSKTGQQKQNEASSVTQKPDAWHVAEFKQHDFEQHQQQKKQEEPSQDVPSQQRQQDQPLQPERQQEYQNQRQHENPAKEAAGDVTEPHFKSSNWDEYGGRNLPTTSSHDNHEDKLNGNNEPTSEMGDGNSNDKKNVGKDGEDPNMHMERRLVRAKRDQWRQEEEKRMLAQKEGAAERLRQLDEKSGRTNTNRNDDDGQDGGDAATAGNAWQSKNQQEQQHPVNSRAAALDRNTKNETPTDRMERSNRRQPNGDRGGGGGNNKYLFDPNASSGSGNGRQQSSNERSPRMNGADGPNTGRNGYRPRLDSETDLSRSSTEDKMEVIHLSSYDDQDRGNRGAVAGGPRMLFDPKSGSMVEAGSAGPQSTKRSRRAGQKRTERRKEFRSDVGRDTAGGRGNGGKEGRGGRSSGGRGRGTPNKKKDFPEPTTLPRTCGVLYARNDDGNYYCVDGEEAELGYGAHSVPGGRVKNPEAYVKYEDTKKQDRKKDTKNKAQSNKQVKAPSRKERLLMKLEQQEHTSKKKEKLRKPTPRSKRWKQNSGNDDTVPFDGVQDDYGVEGENEESVLHHDWVKHDDKLELITGVESPTLQATAKEFSPATFNAQTKKGKKNKEPPKPNSKTSKNKKAETEHQEDEPRLGLGFDPALSMASVMHSPMADNAGPSDGLDHVDLTALSLEPALKASAKTTSNIFAFESGSTWGSNNHGGGIGGSEWGATTNNPGASNDWALPASSGENTGFGSSPSPASFLTPSLTGNTWGGFTTTSTLNGRDQNNTTGD